MSDGPRAGLEAVLFDWGGTLTPWHTIDLREQWGFYTAVYDPDHADELAAHLADAEVGLWSRARDHRRSATFDELLAGAGIDVASPHHEAALAAYNAGWEPHTLLDPDVPALLRALRDLGLRLGVLSNTLWTRAFHEQVFARDGVLELFDAAVYSSEVPWTKPHPEAFLSAMRAVGVHDPVRCVFVGDRPHDDILGAREVGMRAVLVPHSDIPLDQQGPAGRPDAVVPRLRDLLPVVRAWHLGQ